MFRNIALFRWMSSLSKDNRTVFKYLNLMWVLLDKSEVFHMFLLEQHWGLFYQSVYTEEGEPSEIKNFNQCCHVF